jgi:phosphatidylglycerol:prolipoprotein diacylglycerol transferase
MFINNIDPVLFEIGPFEIRYYGIIYALGFLIGIWFFQYFAKKGLINLNKEQINDLFFWLIIGKTKYRSENLVHR